MPVPVTKYTCQFKCGHKAVADIRKMTAHEMSFCFNNPESKTCATCVNQIYDRDYDDYKVWYGRGCKIEMLNNFLEDVQQDLTLEPSNHIKPLWHCPSHNLSEAHPLTEIFIDEVKAKIEAKRVSIEESNKLLF